MVRTCTSGAASPYADSHGITDVGILLDARLW